MFNFSYSAALLNMMQILLVWLDIPVAAYSWDGSIFQSQILLGWLDILVADTPGMARYSSQYHNPDIVSICPRSIPINVSAKHRRAQYH